MATKKANGGGSIQKYYQKGKLKGWRGTVSYGYDDKGKLKRKQFYGKTKQEVLDKMTQFQYKQNTGLLPADDKITLSEWFYTWLFEFRINDLKPSSFKRYESIYRKYIEDSPIGVIKLADLRAPHIQNYYNDLLKNKISIGVVNTINGFLHTCLNEALAQNYIPKNYCKSIRLPKETKTESITVTVFTLDEQMKFLKAVQGHKYEMAFTLDLDTGLRLGELLALKWKDMDFINNTLRVNKSIKRVTFIDKNGKRENKIIEQTPKTESSNRTVPIPENIIKDLKKYKIKQLEIKLKNKEFYSDHDYIFCDEFGNPLDPKKIPRNFKSILKKAGMRDIKFHSLRHTYATRLFEAGVPIKTVQALMGHNDIATTMNIYTHVMPEQKSQAAAKINNLFVL